MPVNTVFPDTPSPEKAWLYEILLNLKTSIKKKKKTSNLPSDLSCIGFGSVKLKISNHISARSWIRWQDMSSVSKDFSERMNCPKCAFDCVSTSVVKKKSGEQKGEQALVAGLCYSDQ